MPKCKEMSLLGRPRALLSLNWLDAMATLLRRTTFPSLLLIRYWFLSVIVIVSIQIIQGVIKTPVHPYFHLLSCITTHCVTTVIPSFTHMIIVGLLTEYVKVGSSRM